MIRFVKKTTAADLRAERAKARLLQQDLAAAMGLASRSLRDWENGKVKLTPERVAQYRAAVARLTRQGAA